MTKIHQFNYIKTIVNVFENLFITKLIMAIALLTFKPNFVLILLGKDGFKCNILLKTKTITKKPLTKLYNVKFSAYLFYF